MESKTAGLARFGEEFVVRGESAVRVAPSRNRFKAVFLQSVLFDDPIPYRTLVGHGPREIDVPWRSQLHPKKTGEFRPYVLPSDKITVGDVESLVRTFRIG